MTDTNQTSDIKTEVVVSQSAKDQAAKVAELMASGKTLEEALTLTAVKSTRQLVDRIALINSLNNLEELRKAKKTAYAKKSKSKDKPEACLRYDDEIKASSAKINEILAIVGKAPEPWKAALEYGDTPDGALQYFITAKELEVEEKMKVLTGTKATVKALVNSCQPESSFVPEQLREPFDRRLKNRDQRLYTLAQRVALVNGLGDGTIKPTEPVDTQADPIGDLKNEKAKSKQASR